MCVCVCVCVCVCTKCLAYVLVSVLQRELEEFKELWNTHTIRYNRRIEAPHGIPNDLYTMPSESGCATYNKWLNCWMLAVFLMTIIGASEQRCTINVEVWAHLMQQAADPPSFYDKTFEFLAKDFLLRYYDISESDFTTSNISEIYCNMVEHFT